MNETINDPGRSADPGADTQAPQSAPQPPPHQDLGRLRRSTSNRYVAGVAGGLGRHFNVDPTILRVLLVVLTFFGGAGLIVYVACWLFVPEDDADHAAIRVGAEPRKILLLAAAAIALLLAVGDAFDGGDTGWFFVSIAAVAAVVLIIRDRRGDRAARKRATAAADAGFATSATQVAPGVSAYEDREDTAVLGGSGQPPAWQPPVAKPPLIPPRPKRTGVLWFWPTLALIAVALGILALYDNDNHVADGAYPALALAVTGVMLVVASIVGRAGGLILLGFLSSVALAASVVVGGSFGVDAKQIEVAPATASAVESEYETTVGEIKLDLTGVSDPEELAGREIDLHLRTGHIEVIVPRTLNVDIDAQMEWAGGITVPGDDDGGVNHEVQRSLTAVPASTLPPLELDIDAKFGQITVEYR